uniref:Uncharacterized protein n=1 Tax=Chromera velia CCMP2878 TaxID=1169474 RepID=A0A0G4H184_9ALVE|eukprot:Cvel_826.t1-p1 / transcript=Cvel_826.t1 / gene=Cvel_826 / organism=Chromera_velia_CCMP2878 / gene_product=hypothetical protein / transcript_product=hypothetical protein / location=Cvel_scaffold25:187130-188269(+) / protein_length=215 / sequence_SO=supercontig / SO=protein_coding / is_pseudo=false
MRGGEATTRSPPLLQRRDDKIRSPEWEDRLRSRVTFYRTPPLPAASMPSRSLEHERIGGGGQRRRPSDSVARRLPSTSSSVLQMQGGGFETAYEDEDNDDTITVEQVQLPRARENARQNPGMQPSSQQNTHGGMSARAPSSSSFSEGQDEQCRWALYCEGFALGMASSEDEQHFLFSPFGGLRECCQWGSMQEREGHEIICIEEPGLLEVQRVNP